MNNLTVGVGGTLDLGGFALTAISVSNDGTIRAEGGETVTVNGNSPPNPADFDTDSGTVRYYGAAGANSYGPPALGNAYFNLIIEDSVDADDDWALGAALDVDGTLTVQNATLAMGAQNLTVAGAVQLNNGAVVTQTTGNFVAAGTTTIDIGAGNDLTLADPDNDFNSDDAGRCRDDHLSAERYPRQR